MLSSSIFTKHRTGLRYILPKYQVWKDQIIQKVIRLYNKNVSVYGE